MCNTVHIRSYNVKEESPISRFFLAFPPKHPYENHPQALSFKVHYWTSEGTILWYQWMGN